MESFGTTAKRIGAFWLGTFAPAALVVGAALRNDWSALLGFQGTIFGCAAVWAYCWVRNGAANWRWVFLSGWVSGALVTALAWLARGGEVEASVLLGVIQSGVNALSFRLVAYAFTGVPAVATSTERPSVSRIL